MNYKITIFIIFNKYNLRKLHLILLFSIAFNVVISYAQQRRFGHYGVPEGLPQETVLCIDNDSNDFLWLGTSDGTVRYDGTNFFTPPKDEKTGLDLSGWLVGSLLVDKNIVYNGTAQKGILAYDFLANTTTQIGLPNSNCSALAKGTDGIYIGYYNKGIGFLDAFGNFKSLSFKNRTVTNAVTIITYKSHVYLGTDKGELLRFSNQDLLEDNALKIEEIAIFTEGIKRLIVKEQVLLLATKQGLFTYNGATVSPVSIGKTDSIENIPFSVVDVSISETKTFIATTQGLLEGTWSGENRFEYSSHYRAGAKYDPFTVNRDKIIDIHLHKDVLSIGHNSLDLTSVTKAQIFKSIIAEYALGDPSVFSVFESKTQLWVGTTSGLLIIDKNTKKYILLSGIKAATITTDNKGNIWVGTLTGLLLFPEKEFNYTNPEIVSLSSIKADTLTLVKPYARHLFVNHLNELWVATYKQGVFKFTGDIASKTYTFEAIVAGKSLKNLASPILLNINQDLEKNYWIATQKGLCKMSFDLGGNPTFKNYYEEDGLATNGVLNTYIATSGTLWVATRKGLSKYIEEKDSFISYNKRDGLSNTFVYNILEDESQNLWLSTNGGLFKFNPEKENFANYTPKDGVQSTEFNLGAAFKNQEGALYFGGIAGLNKFYSNQVGLLDKESTLRFTNFKSKQEELSNTNIKTKKITINHDEFPLEISFSALDFRPSKNINYQYRLSSEKQKWNYLGDKNEVQFLSLPAGNHTLEIQGVSRGNPWKQKPLSLALTITPPWYKSTLAFIGYGLLFFTGVYVYYKISVQRKLAGQEALRLQELDALKSRFITNITHEFRTPLTIILGYLGNLKERFSGKADVNMSLDTIEQNSNNLLNLVNQMLDLAKLEKGQLNLNLIQNDIVAFSNRIVDSFISIASDKHIKLNFNSNPNKIIMDFDAEKMRQILTNIISNALKFSPENSELKINLEAINTDTLQVEIIDEGYGISEDELPFIFDRFYQVENNEDKVSQGTGIGLALTKELVELFKGSIHVKSKLGSGTSFTITLPITNTAEEKNLDLSDSQLTIGTVVPQLNDIITDDDSNTVLIVEDNADMARYIASCLQQEYKVNFAKDGKEGLELATSQIPDIVVTDVMMPIMDGFELTQKLQANTNTNHIPIIMLTSKAMQEDKIEGITSGADAYLTKPFQKEELRLRMQMLISKRKQLQARYTVNTIVEQKEEQTKPTDKNLIFLNSVIDAVHKHLDDSNFGATELAKFLAMSDSQLYRKLKAISNTSTAIFMRKVRLEKGKELLKNSDLSVSEIAYATGFNDPNWFSKTFKDEFEQSPTGFRN